MATFPRRFRLHGGRNTHAARTVNGGEEDRTVTACDYMAGPKDEPKPDDAVITCQACVRAINRQTAMEA